jgi:hypothetical protein
MKRPLATVALTIAAAVAIAAPDARADDPPLATWPATLEYPVPIAMSAGQEVAVRGALRTSFDGAIFDAATRTDTLPDGTTLARPGGLLDAAAGGLALVAFDPATHLARFTWTGEDAPACRANGLASPCLVPRLDDLAHERLLTHDDFVATLRGRVDVIAPAAPITPVVSPAARRGLSAAALALGLFAAVAAALAWSRARGRTPMGQVRAAAREAHKATRHDPMLAPVRAQIAHLMDRARELDRARRACRSKLAGIDRPALERRRAGWATSTARDAAEAYAWVSAEHAEAARLESDLAASVAGLDRIASALRVITLRARSHRGVRARIAVDPVDAVASELTIRDEAIAEADRAS